MDHIYQVFHELYFLLLVYLPMAHGNRLLANQLLHRGRVARLYDLVLALDNLPDVVGAIDPDHSLSEQACLEDTSVLLVFFRKVCHLKEKCVFRLES